VTKEPSASKSRAAEGLPASEIDAVVRGRHRDPFAVLGVQGEGARLIARAFVEGAEELDAFTLAGKPAGTLERRHDAGFFEGRLTIRERQPLRYRARRGGAEWWVTDPYGFGPVLGPMDDYYIGERSHLRLYDKLGAHPIHHEGADGVHFAVWAPNASRVSVVGDFNAWDGRRHAMRLRIDTGIWEIFVPDVGPGVAYKYEILASDGTPMPLKADPFAFATELRPANASKVAPPLVHDWGDGAHRAHWAAADPRRQPISIYEVHPGSWRRHGDGGS
jgi:1,4-alpha-glucan branching enzyme